MKRASVLLGSFIVAACGKSGAPEGKPSAPAAAPAPAPAPAANALLAGDEAKRILEGLQGAWIMPFLHRRDPGEVSPFKGEVWAISGTALVRDNGLVEEPRQIELLAPCLMRLVKERKGPKTSFSYRAFLLHDGKLHVAERIGARQGDRILVCSDVGSAFTYEAGKCQQWERGVVNRGDALRAKPVECALETRDGGEVLRVGTGDLAWDYVVDGGLVYAGSRPEPATRFATRAEAEAAARQ